METTNNVRKCKICLNRFKATRSDARYCSNACKQRAHTRRRTQASSKDEYIFFLDEYQAICQEYGYEAEIFTFIFFCFLRKNLAQDAKLETVKAYIDSVWTVHNFEELTHSNAYRYFHENFLKLQANVVQSRRPLS